MNINEWTIWWDIIVNQLMYNLVYSIIIFVLIISILVVIKIYLYRLAKRINYHKKWFVWLPILDMYFIFDIINQKKSFILFFLVYNLLCFLNPFFGIIYYIILLSPFIIFPLFKIKIKNFSQNSEYKNNYTKIWYKDSEFYLTLLIVFIFIMVINIFLYFNN